MEYHASTAHGPHVRRGTPPHTIQDSLSDRDTLPANSVVMEDFPVADPGLPQPKRQKQTCPIRYFRVYIVGMRVVGTWVLEPASSIVAEHCSPIADRARDKVGAYSPHVGRGGAPDAAETGPACRTETPDQTIRYNGARSVPTRAESPPTAHTSEGEGTPRCSTVERPGTDRDPTTRSSRRNGVSRHSW